MYYKNPGAYGVPYLFVICGFSLPETQTVSLARRSLVRRRLLGRTLETTIWTLFDIQFRCGAKPDTICRFLQVTDPSFDTFLTPMHLNLPSSGLIDHVEDFGAINYDRFLASMTRS